MFIRYRRFAGGPGYNVRPADRKHCLPYETAIVERGARMSPFVKDIRRNFNYHKQERDNMCKHRKDHSPMGNHRSSP